VGGDRQKLMTEQEIRQIIRDELSYFIKDKFVFTKHLQLLDGRNIQVGQTTGTKIGTATTQKIGFLGAVPIIRQSVIGSPSAPGGTYVQAEVASAKTAIDLIIAVLKNFGLTA
jgi:hypothetical protein